MCQNARTWIGSFTIDSNPFVGTLTNVHVDAVHTRARVLTRSADAFVEICSNQYSISSSDAKPFTEESTLKMLDLKHRFRLITYLANECLQLSQVHSDRGLRRRTLGKQCIHLDSPDHTYMCNFSEYDLRVLIIIIIATLFQFMKYEKHRWARVIWMINL